MTRVCIGIHVYAEPERLFATLASLPANTPGEIDCVLLPDGPDSATSAALAKLRHLPQLGASAPLGGAGCFNRLAAFSDADVVVLLESGAQVGPGWLDHLLAALNSDARNGLAGPTTNRSWNEQGVFSKCASSTESIAWAAREAKSRFGSQVRLLAPLYSLSDFCYAVRREVVEAIGGADESYGLGPCWEMDYNIRAARAGWRGVWACGAYVHRAPFTARRRREETLRFEASKRRYQDKFCALRLRGERGDYEPHCKGDECEHFAPASLIQVTIPLAREFEIRAVRGSIPAVATANRTAAEQQAESPAPLMSCVMATRDRGEFVLQSISYFQRQDYPTRELIIIDDGRDNLEDTLPVDSRIRYVRLPERRSIGAKRNLGCELARGDIIAQWDDDDWYSPERLSVQAAPLLSGGADISGLIAGVFFDLPRWEFWRCTPELHRRLFVEDVHGGTLVYWRRVWEKLARYPDCSLAEDAGFLRQAVRRGARLRRTQQDRLFVYLRHATNSWSFNCGQFLDSRGWLRTSEPALPPGDRAFYASRSAAAPASESAPPVPEEQIEGPLVSCIMPTYNRRPFVAQAIAYFLRQSYTNSEMIVVDDGDDAVGDLIPAGERVRYVRLKTRLTIGAKRNLACEQARGEMIVHWDDDDWMASWRLGYQVKSMAQNGADLCGLDKLLFYDPQTDRAWQYVYPCGGKFWVAGNSLCYKKSFWRENPFPNINVGEDTRFVWNGGARKMIALPDSSFCVAMIHPGNTSRKRTSDPRYRTVAAEQIRQIMGGDFEDHARIVSSLCSAISDTPPVGTNSI